MTDSNMNCYQSLARALKSQRCDTVFGLMGDANLFLLDSYVRECGGKFVPVMHEGSGVLMALAYAHVANKVGVASITHGPALTNCVTALTEGARGRIPMVLLAGDTPVAQPRHGQNIDQREVVKVTGAGFEQMRTPQTATQDLARAFYRAAVERRPIVLNMPADFMWQTVRHEAPVLDVYSASGSVAEGDALDNAIGMIAAARRPLIVAGGGAVDGREAIIALADRIEAPLATTLKAKGLFTGHPYNMDIFGTLSTPAAYDLIASADCIICFGASLHDFTTDKGRLTADKRIIQIDRDAALIGGSIHPDVGIVADAGLAAATFHHWLDEAEIPASGFTRDIDAGTLLVHPLTKPGATEGCVNYAHALARLDSALPDDRVLVTDGGRFMTEVWCRIAARDPQSFVVTANFGAIGLGLQEAIGAAVAAPDRQVVLFTGDGGFMMGGLSEFNTAVRLGLNLVVIVANDAAYGAEHIQMVDRQMDASLTQFAWPSFAETARALGGRGIDVRSDADLDEAIEAIATGQGPLLIDMHLDTRDVPRMRL